MVALQDALRALAQVLQEVPTVEHLHRLRGSLLDAPLVFRRAVATHDAYLSVLLEPGGECLRRAVFQQFYGPMPFKVHDDRAVLPALQEREVVYADDLGRRERTGLRAVKSPQQRGRARLHAQTLRQSRAGFATEGEAHHEQDLPQPSCLSGVGLHDRRQPLGEDTAKASRFVTPEAPNAQGETNGTAAPRQVGKSAPVAAV